MRETVVLKCELHLRHLGHIPYRHPSHQRLSVSSHRSPYIIPVPSRPKAHRQSVQSRGGKIKRLRGLAGHAEGLRISPDLQAFTNWLIESGVEGINGDTQKVEIYQYGEDGRGLRATTVLAILLLPYPQGNYRVSGGHHSMQDVRAYDEVLR